MKKKLVCLLVMGMITGLLAGCGQSSVSSNESGTGQNTEIQQNKVWEAPANAVSIALSDNGITVDGQAIATDESADVYAANDIVFYLADQGFTYGEGSVEDEHTQEEADAHTVVHITKPGEYVLSGALSAGQIAIDLGKDAEEDPNAVVTLYLNGVDVNCDVAPAVIFYNVYECGNTDEAAATKDVDTSKAGANVVIVDNTVNTVNGSYVARIYKSYTLNDAGTEVVDNKKLHKYDGAFYSKMSMNVDGGEADTGILNINAENEGLDTELHLTINGGIININSGNDGINTNEDNISVTTLNGGWLNIVVNGSTGEGDGIDSNGWLVINGGTLTSNGCGFSMDAGIDSDMGIHLNGGNIIASGNMLDMIAGNEQPYVVFSSRSRLEGGITYTVKDAEGKEVGKYTPVNSFTYLIISYENMSDEGGYTLWSGETQVAQGTSGMNGMGRPGMGGFGGFPGGEMPQMPEGGFPEGGFGNFGGFLGGEMPQMPEGGFPEGGFGDFGGFPGGEMPQMPEGGFPEGGFGDFGGFQGGEMPQMPEGGFSGGNFPGGERPSGGFQGSGFQKGTEKK